LVTQSAAKGSSDSRDECADIVPSMENNDFNGGVAEKFRTREWADHARVVRSAHGTTGQTSRCCERGCDSQAAAQTEICAAACG
jgi:hypothetical protein